MMAFQKPTLYLHKLKKLNPTFLDIQGPQKIQKKIWTYKIFNVGTGSSFVGSFKITQLQKL